MLVSPPIVTPISCAVVEVESGAMLRHDGWERFVETYLFFKYHSKTDVGPGALRHSGAGMRSSVTCIKYGIKKVCKYVQKKI